MDILETLKTLWTDSGFQSFFVDGGWKNLVMIVISCVLLYLGIKKKFEPLLLVGIAFGCLLVNISNFGPGSTDALYHPELWDAFLDKSSPDYHSYGAIMANNPGLLDILYIGVKAGIYPSLIFMGVGAMTDLVRLLQIRSVCFLVQQHRWVYSLHFSEQYVWALQANRQHQSVLSAVLMVLQRYSSPQSLLLNSSDLLRLPHTHTWR